MPSKRGGCSLPPLHLRRTHQTTFIQRLVRHLERCSLSGVCEDQGRQRRVNLSALKSGVNTISKRFVKWRNDLYLCVLLSIRSGVPSFATIDWNRSREKSRLRAPSQRRRRAQPAKSSVRMLQGDRMGELILLFDVSIKYYK